MNIITIGTLKGGVGKSSVTFNLAGILAENHRVLLIDVDPQTNLSLNCGVDVTERSLRTIKSVFEDRVKLEDVVFKSPMICMPNIDIIPSSILLTSTELQIISMAGRENILRNFMLDNEKAFLEYDYVLIDTNPSMGIINQNAFLVADSIILVSDISLNGIQGAELFIALWNNVRRQLRKEDNIKALILNNYDNRIKLSSELVEYCKENDSVKDIILNTVIYNTVKLKETELEHQPINVLHRNSNIHKVYINAVDELMKRRAI